MSEKRDCILVIDLEATCWRGNPPQGMFNEIIEIGVAVVDAASREVVDKESLIIKPEYSEISDFCTELTTLTQSYVDSNGISFRNACDILVNKYKSDRRLWASWGKYDYNQIRKDCELKKVKFPMGRDHYNLKPLFSFKNNINKDLGVDGALRHLGLEFKGTHHRGVDDAVNIARIFKTII